MEKLDTILRRVVAKLRRQQEEFSAQQAQGASAGPGTGADTCPTVGADRSAMGETSAAGFGKIEYLGLASPRPGYAAGLA